MVPSVRAGTRFLEPNPTCPCHRRSLSDPEPGPGPYYTRKMEQDQIPGPKVLPFVGTSYKYLVPALLGGWGSRRPAWTAERLFRQFGPLVRERLGGGEVLHVYRPQHVAEAVKAEGGYPVRWSYAPLRRLRELRLDVFQGHGLLAENGWSWLHLRERMDDILLSDAVANSYIPKANAILDRFAPFIALKTKEGPKNSMRYFVLLFQDMVGAMLFGVDMATFDSFSPYVTGTTLRSGARDMNNVLTLYQTGSHFAYYRMVLRTPAYLKLKRGHTVMERFFVPLVRERAEWLNRRRASGREDDEAPSIVDLLLQDGRLSLREINGAIIDLFITPWELLPYTAAFALYNIATNESVQEALFKEALALLPAKASPVTEAVLNAAEYTKAVVRETFRHSPPAFGLVKQMQQPTVIDGYFVKATTYVLVHNEVACRLPQYFWNPDAFYPERWLQDMEPHEEYLVQPYGVGARTCVGHKLADVCLQVFLLRMIRNYSVVWCGGNLGSIGTPNMPDYPLVFVYNKRRE